MLTFAQPPIRLPIMLDQASKESLWIGARRQDSRGLTCCLVGGLLGLGVSSHRGPVTAFTVTDLGLKPDSC